MKIKEIYEAMHVAGLTSSQMEFSRIWLGRSPRYYSHLIAVDREPGLATLCGIVWRLERLIERTPHKESNPLLFLKQAIGQHIERRAIIDVRRPRKPDLSEKSLIEAASIEKLSTDMGRQFS
jgi:hypothetical protein